MSEESGDVPVVGTELPYPTITEPSLDLTLAVTTGRADKEPDNVIDLADSSSEAEDGTGGFGPVF